MPLRCLIVDDNPQFAEVAGRLLEREGLVVLAKASTGAEAIDLVRKFRPDVVILDIDLGTESGFDVARQLDASRSQSEPDTAPEIIFVSAHDEEDFADLISDSVAIGFLAKSALSARAIVQLVSANSQQQ
jgi:DNA-binding NarL/FixJ family response regulator